MVLLAFIHCVSISSAPLASFSMQQHPLPFPAEIFGKCGRHKKGACEKRRRQHAKEIKVEETSAYFELFKKRQLKKTACEMTRPRNDTINAVELIRPWTTLESANHAYARWSEALFSAKKPIFWLSVIQSPCKGAKETSSPTRNFFRRRVDKVLSWTGFAKSMLDGKTLRSRRHSRYRTLTNMNSYRINKNILCSMTCSGEQQEEWEISNKYKKYL